MIPPSGLPPPPPVPEIRVAFVPGLAMGLICFVLSAFASRLATLPELVFCLAHSVLLTGVLFKLSATIRLRLIPRLRFRLDPPWRRSAFILGLLFIFVIGVNLIEREALGGFYLHNGWLLPENLTRFLDASLLVRICTLLAIGGFFSAQLSFRRMEQSLLSQAAAQQAAVEAERQRDEAERRRAQAELEASAARQLATEAELTALKMQINPHFLFNTLGSIAALARLDGARAGVMTEKLAEMFRYILQASTRPSVSLGEELDFLQNYLEIERARFGERLTLEIAVPAEFRGLSVPNLLLQPMVENAIVHAFGDMKCGWRVEVRAQRRGDEVELTVADNGRGFGDEAPRDFIGRGTALKNIDERLRRFYGPAHGLEVEQRASAGACFRVCVPSAEPRPARIASEGAAPGVFSTP